jgi:hypothetical protein
MFHSDAAGQSSSFPERASLATSMLRALSCAINVLLKVQVAREVNSYE